MLRGCSGVVPGCSGLFRAVPGVFRGCSGAFRGVPGVFRGVPGCSGVFRVLQTPDLLDLLESELNLNIFVLFEGKANEIYSAAGCDSK